MNRTTALCTATALLTVFLILGGCANTMTPLTTTATATATATKHTDLTYATTSSANRLDLYLPTGTGPFPLVVWIHGGAFKMGTKAMISSAEVTALTSAGYAVASINYRLSGEAVFPAQINDVKAAIRWLRANASTYNLNTAQFAAWGGSAGGGLASLAGTSGGVADLEDLSQGNPNQSSRVQAVVDLFGPIDFLAMNGQWTLLGVTNGEDHNTASSPESALVGGAIQSLAAACQRYNPTTYIDPTDPPFCIQHGDADIQIPYLQSKNFAAALSPVLGSSKVSFTLLAGAGHADAAFTSTSNLAKLVAFLDGYLK